METLLCSLSARPITVYEGGAPHRYTCLSGARRGDAPAPEKGKVIFLADHRPSAPCLSLAGSPEEAVPACPEGPAPRAESSLPLGARLWALLPDLCATAAVLLMAAVVTIRFLAPA